MTSTISVDNITKSYGETRVIGPTSLDVAEGEFVSLLGPSGSGKSTILNMIAGLAFPSTGTVSAFGKEITGPGPERGLVFQDHALLPWKTARGNIDFGLLSAHPELSAAERAKRTDDVLGRVGLSHAADRRPARLSGGMQQRVGLARAFAIDSKILLLDEPFGALDALTRRELQNLLLEIWETNRRTVVMVTHDVEEAILLSDRILVMSPGPDATIIEDLKVDIRRPRHGAAESDTGEMRRHLLGLLEHR
ncbi:ABC transporter ATP-binding protein [Corynebacterium sp. S7]